jgi:hypothetical protein
MRLCSEDSCQRRPDGGQQSIILDERIVEYANLRMSAEQIAQAEKLADAWQPRTCIYTHDGEEVTVTISFE